MPTTSNFGWTTPADTDLVKDGAAAIRTLGNGIDTSLVDLKGGTTGQILSKNSNTDLDYTWINNDQGDITEVQAGTGISVASGTGPVPVVTNTVATTFDAKGDLVVGTGADTFAKLTVGTNGHILVADSAETTGLKWAAAQTPSFVGCVLQKTASQTISNSTVTFVTWNDELVDTDGFHDNSTNTSRITIPSGKGGKYQINFIITYASNNTGYRQGGIRLNGSTLINLEEKNAVTGSETTMSLSIIYALSAGDYIEVRSFQNSGGNLDITASYTSSFSVVYLGA